MRDIAARAGIGIAVSAAALALVCLFFVPYGYPWPSVAWAVLACGAAVWVAKASGRQGISMSEVIGGVEAEPDRRPALGGAGAGSRGTAP